MKTATQTAVVIDADGFFGDYATVWFAGTLGQCQAFAKRRSCQIVAGCEKEKGDKIASGVLRDMLSAGNWSIVR